MSLVFGPVVRAGRVGLARLGAECATVALGLALVWAAVVGMDRAWMERHFLPLFSLDAEDFARRLALGRAAVAALGVTAILGLRPLAGRLAEVPARVLAAGALRIGIAVALALAVSEPILRLAVRAATEAAPPDQEPRRRPDARLGWAYVPNRVGYARVAGRTIDYAFDAWGERVERLDRPVDPDRPTVLFVGESIMGGYGLTWAESVPTQTAQRLGLQAANLSVAAYANDQAYLRLAQDLPRFRRPVAVVSLFMPRLLFRDLNTDRPFVEADLAWRPARPRLRLLALAQYGVPVRSEAAIARGVARARAVLQASARLACARGAAPLVLVPQFGAETAAEASLRRRVLDGAGVDYAIVRLDPAWRLAGDRHPDARAAAAMAAAVAARLSSPGRPRCPAERDTLAAVSNW